ncbi:hypothetical protein ACFL6N_03085 [Thermodesulfobacteriota bacterium]
MNLVIAVFLVVAISLLAQTQFLPVLLVCFLAGVIFVGLHSLYFKNANEDEPIGIAYLVVVLAASIGIMSPGIFVESIQVSGIFLSGTLFYMSLRQMTPNA